MRGSTGAEGQRTVNVVALAVRGSGPIAKRFGLIDAFLPKPSGREYDGKNEHKCEVEAGADDGADVEIAAAAAAFDVRRYAHVQLVTMVSINAQWFGRNAIEWEIKRETSAHRSFF